MDALRVLDKARGIDARSARTGPGTRGRVGLPVRAGLAERIEVLDGDMGAALARGDYEQAVHLAEEQERLLEALMA